MIKYAKITNKQTGLCEVGLGTNTKFYQSIGMQQLDVQQSDIDNNWYHLDLTWDDPVTKNSDVDTLSHQFFMVNTEKLLEFDTKDHRFDTIVYQELN